MEFPSTYCCQKANRPIKLTGKMDDPQWELAPWTENFVDILGAQGPAPRFKTRAKMLWDSEYFYFAAELEDPHLVATLTERDSIVFHDNDFEIFLDPDGDGHGYYEFEINPHGTVFDLFLPLPYKDSGRAIIPYDFPKLQTAVSLAGTLNDPSDVDKGWTVEVGLHWSSFFDVYATPQHPAPGDVWRVNFSRVQWIYDIIEGQYRKRPDAPEDNWVWSPQGVIDMHRPETWGFVQFVEGPPNHDFSQQRAVWRIQMQLAEIGYALKAHLKSHGHYATSLTELGISAECGVRIETTSSGFEVCIEQAGVRHRMDHYSRFWAD